MKRVISLFTVVVMLILSVNIGVFAAESDTYNEKLYSDACGIINSLDAGVSVGENSIDADISRIELLRNAFMILNKGLSLDNMSKGEISLTDIGDADRGYLEFAAYCGLINYQDKYFYPDKPADYNFALRTLLCLISYYNDNTTNKLLQGDIIKGVRSSASTSFKAADAYVMIYNLIMSENPYGVFSGTPILKGLYDLEKVKVKIIGDDLSSYDGQATVAGRIKVSFSNGATDDLSYSGDAKEFLGRYVYMYYNAKEESVAFMTPCKEDDIIVELGEKEFESYDKDTRKIYWKEFKASSRWESSYTEKKKDISKTADIIYNGVYMSDQNRVYDMLESNTENIDKIQLISTDNSQKIDLIKIDAYTTAYVENVNSDGYVIRDKAGDRLITLDPNDEVESVTVEDTDGNPIVFQNIATKSIVSIFDIPGQKQRYKLIVSKNAMDGMVSSVKDDNNRRFAVADGIEYQIANGLSDYADRMQLNSNYILYTDHNGLIAGYEQGSLSRENVGGIISMIFHENDGPFDFKLFTVNGEIKEYSTRSGFKVNGAKTKINSDMTITYCNSNDETVTKSILDFKTYLQGGLIQYKLDGEGKIREIIVPRKNAKPGNIGYTMGMNDPDTVISNPSLGKMRFKKNSNYFIPHENASVHNFTAVNSNTKVINIPSAEFTDRKDYYSIGKLGDLKNDYQAGILAYTFEGGKAVTADIIAIVQGGSSTPSGSVFYIVKKIVDSVNKQGEVGKLIRCLDVQSGAEMEFTTEKQEFPKYNSATGETLPISVGDIIQIGTNAYGDASSFILTYDCDAGTVQTSSPNNWYAEKRLVKAFVYSVSDSHFTYVTGDPTESPDEIQIGTCKSVIYVDQKGDDYEIKAGAPSSLVGYSENPDSYSTVIYITIYGEARACVAYR